MSCWVEPKYIQYFTLSNHDTKLKENTSTAIFKKGINKAGFSLFSSASWFCELTLIQFLKILSLTTTKEKGTSC